ncbi:MAG: hypothetical protein LBS91_04875 [Clostridiales Family XIII bacterium]|jgi:outer membrane lipoprotein-sorting protein|nr:hypothetical protein [Clostridiales Family XIII bacterium]
MAMCKIIGIEDLAANALITLLEDSGEQKVSFEQIIRYGNTIREKYDTTFDDYVVLIFSGERVTSFIRDYSDYFEIQYDGGKKYIAIKSDLEMPEIIKYLRETFRSRLPIDLLYSFTCQEALDSLAA